MKAYPKKSLGQHYLTDENISRNIVNSFKIEEEDKVIEIGPGEGALTKFIITKTNNLTAIEVDKKNCTILGKKFKGLDVVNKDFLKFDLNSKVKPSNSKFRIIGNIPYNITSEIIFKLIDNRHIISDAQLMIQDEVAVRLTAKPNSKDYGIPSVLLQAFSNTSVKFKVSRNCFYPKPRVDSRIIYIDFTKSCEKEINNIEFFKKFVKSAFSTRRKTLKNSLKQLDLELGKADFDFTRRAETLSVNEFINLSNLFCTAV